MILIKEDFFSEKFLWRMLTHKNRKAYLKNRRKCKNEKKSFSVNENKIFYLDKLRGLGSRRAKKHILRKTNCISLRLMIEKRKSDKKECIAAFNRPSLRGVEQALFLVCYLWETVIARSPGLLLLFELCAGY